MLNRKAVDIAAPNLISVCVDESVNNEKTGRFYHRYFKEPVSFKELSYILVLAEQLMDRIDYPQASTWSRDFYGRKKDIREKGVKPVRTAEEILSEAGRKGTFVVNVLYRQNATWQGKVLWAETGKSCNFRSALELLKLMDNALDETETCAEENASKPACAQQQTHLHT